RLEDRDSGSPTAPTLASTAFHQSLQGKSIMAFSTKGMIFKAHSAIALPLLFVHWTAAKSKVQRMARRHRISSQPLIVPNLEQSKQISPDCLKIHPNQSDLGAIFGRFCSTQNCYCFALGATAVLVHTTDISVSDVRV